MAIAEPSDEIGSPSGDPRAPDDVEDLAINNPGSIVEQARRDDFVGGEMQNGKWMRRGALKAVSVAPPFGSGEWALDNVVQDPGKTRDLGTEEPELLKELQAAWDRHARDVGVVLTADWSRATRPAHPRHASANPS